ncbi:hypothetical protein MRX96_059144 [Rhipicephalus microplus]
MKTFAAAVCALLVCSVYAEKDEKVEARGGLLGAGLGGYGAGVGGPGLVGAGLGGVGLGGGYGGGFQSGYGNAAGAHQAGFQHGAGGYNQGSGAFAGGASQQERERLQQQPRATATAQASRPLTARTLALDTSRDHLASKEVLPDTKEALDSSHSVTKPELAMVVDTLVR